MLSRAKGLQRTDRYRRKPELITTNKDHDRLHGVQCKGAYFDRIYPRQRNTRERLIASPKKLKLTAT
jgi:hypothetical protein